MPTKPLDRLTFAQGGLCFFCEEPLPKSEASVEHLLASANGGGNNDENCVACCKSVNALFGSMSLKEKFQVVLNQKGQFKCPNGAGSAKPASTPKKDASKVSTVPKVKEDRVNLILTNLDQRGKARPSTLKTLQGTIRSLFPKGISDAEISDLITKLKATGKVVVTADKVTYKL